jgi:hypothetical protein
LIRDHARLRAPRSWPNVRNPSAWRIEAVYDRVLAGDPDAVARYDR